MRRFRPELTPLADRDCPAVLDVTGGVLTFTAGVGESNNLTVSYTGAVYSFKDTGAPVTLGSGAVAVGWRGSGTSTVSGPVASVDTIEIASGDGNNIVNIRSIADPIIVDGGVGTTQVNINSTAPTGGGNLNGIQGAVTVNAGADTSLWVSDRTGTVRPNPIVVDGSGITGLAPHPIAYTGTFTSLRVTGSTSTTLAESYVIDTPPATYFKLEAGNGTNDVTVNGWGLGTTGDFVFGSGDDLMTVLAGIVVDANVDGGAGTNTYQFNTPGFGDVTGTVS